MIISGHAGMITTPTTSTPRLFNCTNCRLGSQRQQKKFVGPKEHTGLIVRPRSAQITRKTPRHAVVASATAGAAAAVAGIPKTYGGVQYPKLYAEGNNAVSVKFNCVQRVHQNTMENLPVFLIMQILLAQAHPLTAAALGAVWATGRVVYALGYSTGDAGKRLPGAIISNWVQLGTLVTLAYTAFKVLTGRPI